MTTHTQQIRVKFNVSSYIGFRGPLYIISHETLIVYLKKSVGYSFKKKKKNSQNVIFLSQNVKILALRNLRLEPF